MKKAAAILLICLLATVLTACRKDNISTVLGIDVRSAEVISDTDTHGWLGDGERFLTLKFSGADAEEKISESPDWRPLPASEGVIAAVWGIEYEKDGEKFGVGPFTSAKIPRVENGWYCYFDRSPEGHALGGDPRSDGFTPPLNFTFAVYDSDEDILYYVESDS